MLVPVELSDANTYLAERKHPMVEEAIFCIGNNDGNGLNGVIVIAKENHETVRLAHACSDGSSGGYTTLYGAAWRAAKALGYKKIII